MTTGGCRGGSRGGGRGGVRGGVGVGVGWVGGDEVVQGGVGQIRATTLASVPPPIATLNLTGACKVVHAKWCIQCTSVCCKVS